MNDLKKRANELVKKRIAKLSDEAISRFERLSEIGLRPSEKRLQAELDYIRASNRLPFPDNDPPKSNP